MKKITAFLMMLAMVASFGVYAQEAAPAMEEAAPAMEEAAPAAPMEMEDDSWMPVVELSATWQSKYMCDGKVVNPHPITALNAFVGLGGFRLDVWSAIDMTEYNRPDGGSRAYKNNREYRTEEIDYEIGYAYTFADLLPFSPLTLDIAWKYFQYPRALFSHDNPLDMTVYLDNLLDPEGAAFLGTGVTFRYDLEHYTWYAWYDVTFGYNFTEKLSASLSSKLYWGTKSKMRAAYGLNRDAISSLLLRAQANYALCEHLTLNAFLEAGYAIDREVRENWKASDINNEENFRAGFGVAYAF